MAHIILHLTSPQQLVYILPILPLVYHPLGSLTLGYHLQEYLPLGYHLLEYHLLQYCLLEYPLLQFHPLCYLLLVYHPLRFHPLGYHLLGYQLLVSPLLVTLLWLFLQELYIPGASTLNLNHTFLLPLLDVTPLLLVGDPITHHHSKSDLQGPAHLKHFTKLQPMRRCQLQQKQFLPNKSSVPSKMQEAKTMV